MPEPNTRGSWIRGIQYGLNTSSIYPVLPVLWTTPLHHLAGDISGKFAFTFVHMLHEIKRSDREYWLFFLFCITIWMEGWISIDEIPAGKDFRERIMRSICTQRSLNKAYTSLKELMTPFDRNSQRFLIQILEDWERFIILRCGFLW